MTTEQKIQYIADHYGYEPQSRQLIEELAELIQAVCKHNRAFDGKKLSESSGCNEKDAIIEEMADVTIMMCQLQHILGIGNLDLDSKIERKLNRQIERIKNE
mgnify:FL=1